MLKTSVPCGLLARAFAVAIAIVAPAWADADATTHQIYEAAESGNLTEAQRMMDQVLHDHPKSGKAHYVAAELYARAGNLSMARQELDTARLLEPGLPFAKAASVRALERQLSGVQPVRARSWTEGPSFLWTVVLAIVAGVGVVWLTTRRRPSPAAVYSQPVGVYPQSQGGALAPAGVPAAQGSAPAPNAASGMGSGIASGLASGLAVGAGVVAGEALARHFVDGDGRESAPPLVASQPVDDPQNADLGGPDFGVTDASSWDDDDATKSDDSDWS